LWFVVSERTTHGGAVDDGRRMTDEGGWTTDDRKQRDERREMRENGIQSTEKTPNTWAGG